MSGLQRVVSQKLRDEILNAIARSIQVCLCVTKSRLQFSDAMGDCLDDMDDVFSAPRTSSSRKSLTSDAFRIDNAAGLFLCYLKLTILMKTTFPQDDGKNERVEQVQTPSKEKGDIESVVSSQC